MADGASRGLRKLSVKPECVRQAAEETIGFQWFQCLTPE